jgi:hypothetical protein
MRCQSRRVGVCHFPGPGPASELAGSMSIHLRDVAAFRPDPHTQANTATKDAYFMNGSGCARIATRSASEHEPSALASSFATSMCQSPSRRLAARTAADVPGTVATTPEQIDAWIPRFEAPDEEELALFDAPAQP